jgi:hypothetical protein
MKKESNQVNPYDEMDFPEQELNETLKLDSKKEVKEEPKQEKDYLDDFTPDTNNSQKQFSQPLMFNDEGKDNLISNLLKVDWERIEHIIRGHKPRVDKEGNEYFVKIDNHYLNDYGVNSMLHFLSFYLSKDIKLGRYSAEQVQMIMKQFSKQFTDFFFDNIVEFGLDTPEKKKMSKMFVQAVIDLVDASYSCAIEGKTIELLLKQFQVLQQQRFEDGGYQTNDNGSIKKPSIMQRIFG